MFDNATYLIKPLLGWDVSNVTDMEVCLMALLLSINISLIGVLIMLQVVVVLATNSPLTEANTPNFTNCTP